MSASNVPRVECTISFSGERKTFTANTFDSNKTYKPHEVTTDHNDGPVKDILQELEAVHLQSNDYLSQAISKITKPTVAGNFINLIFTNLILLGSQQERHQPRKKN